MAILFKNNSKRLENEYKDLETKNNSLYELLTDLMQYCMDVFDKDIVITMIYRTQAEQDDIYKDDPKYKQKKFKSPHQLNSAVDIRSQTFTEKEIKLIENFLNVEFNSVNSYVWTAKNHTVGLGFHFHIQLLKK